MCAAHPDLLAPAPCLGPYDRIPRRRHQRCMRRHRARFHPLSLRARLHRLPLLEGSSTRRSHRRVIVTQAFAIARVEHRAGLVLHVAERTLRRPRATMEAPRAQGLVAVAHLYAPDSRSGTRARSADADIPARRAACGARTPPRPPRPAAARSCRMIRAPSNRMTGGSRSTPRPFLTVPPSTQMSFSTSSVVWSTSQQEQPQPAPMDRCACTPPPGPRGSGSPVASPRTLPTHVHGHCVLNRDFLPLQSQASGCLHPRRPSQPKGLRRPRSTILRRFADEPFRPPPSPIRSISQYRTPLPPISEQIRSSQ